MSDLRWLEGHPIPAAIVFFNPEIPRKIRDYKFHKVEQYGI
jgi:hypothetical protein